MSRTLQRCHAFVSEKLVYFAAPVDKSSAPAPSCGRLPKVAATVHGLHANAECVGSLLDAQEFISHDLLRDGNRIAAQPDTRTAAGAKPATHLALIISRFANLVVA
jgi:hypothetical protein